MSIRVAVGQFHELTEDRLRFALQIGATGLQMNNPTLPGDHRWEEKDVAELVKKVVGYEGELVWDASRPDGTPRKILDSSRIRALGWEPQIDLETGLTSTYRWFLEHAAAAGRS